MLQLRHVFRGGRLLRKIPRQHELRLENGAAGLNAPVWRGGQPADGRMADVLLDIDNELTGIGLVPAAVKVFGDDPELDDEIAREVFRLYFAALLAPQPQQRILVVAHDDPGIRTAD